MMLKKLAALLMALVMTLSCTAAFAQDMSKETMVQLYINPLMVQSAGAMDEEESKMIDTLLDTFNGMKWTVTEGENATRMVFSMNDSAVYEYTLSTDDEGLLVFSDLWPNSVFKLNYAKLGEALEKLLGSLDMDEALNAATESINELSAVLTGSLGGYVDDLMAVAETVMQEAEVDQTTGSAYFSVTSLHAAQLLIKWIERLEKDTVMLNFVQGVADGMAAASGEEPVQVSEMLPGLKAELQANLESGSGVEICALGMYAQADGSMYYELTVGATMLFLMQSYVYGDLNCTEIVMVSAPNGTQDWNATYNGVLNGTDSAASLAGFIFAANEDETQHIYEYYMITGGTQVSVSCETEETGVDTPAWTEKGDISIDISEGDNSVNVMGAAWESKLVEKLEAPSTEGKYVHDVLAFPLDVLLNGMPQYLERLYTAAPDFIQMYVDLITQAFGLEDLPIDLGALLPAAQENANTPSENTGANGNTTVVVTNNAIDDL